MAAADEGPFPDTLARAAVRLTALRCRQFGLGGVLAQVPADATASPSEPAQPDAASDFPQTGHIRCRRVDGLVEKT